MSSSQERAPEDGGSAKRCEDLGIAAARRPLRAASHEKDGLHVSEHSKIGSNL